MAVRSMESWGDIAVIVPIGFRLRQRTTLGHSMDKVRGHRFRAPWRLQGARRPRPLFDEFPLCASDFLVEFLEGRLPSDVLPEGAGPRSVVAHVDRTVPFA